MSQGISDHMMSMIQIIMLRWFSMINPLIFLHTYNHLMNIYLELGRIGYTHHNIHTGPLIRRESYYAEDLMEDRKSLFDSLFNFTRRLDIKYACAKIKKDKSTDVIKMTGQLSREISSILRPHQDMFSKYNQIIVYYDNG